VQVVLVWEPFAAMVTTSRSGTTVRASGPWWLGMAVSGTTVFMIPE
jgi:hypothetical protein